MIHDVALCVGFKMISAFAGSCRLADDVARAARIVRSPPCRAGSIRHRPDRERRSPGKFRQSVNWHGLVGRIARSGDDQVVNHFAGVLDAIGWYAEPMTATEK